MSELNVTTINASIVNAASLVADTLVNQAAQLCKAWVNFNGTGTVAIRDSYNVSSVTDLGTGQYKVNFDTAMADANYSAVTGSSVATAATNIQFANATHSLLTSSFNIRTGNASTTTDNAIVTACVFGD